MSHAQAVAESVVTKAFNQGCEARLAGKPVTECPYEYDAYKISWIRGWQDVHHFFGADAKRPFRQLPAMRSAPVQECQ